MNEQEIGRIRALAVEFVGDRRMEGCSGKTEERILWALDYFAVFLATRDEERLESVTADTMHKYQMHLYNQLGKNGEPLGLASQASALMGVRVFFRWLVRRGYMLADPSSAITLPRRKKPLPRGVMSRREINRVLVAPDVDTPLGLRDRAILELMYSSGLRNNEVRSLAVSDVNTSAGEVRVRNPKGGVDRVVPVGGIAAKYLDLYIREARPKILGWHEDPGLFFVGRWGKKMHGATVNRNIVQKFAERAGVKSDVTAHGVRHTCATHLLKGRASLRHIQRLLGHRSLESTQVYLRVEVGDLKKELKRCHPRERARDIGPDGGLRPDGGPHPDGDASWN
jgi:integrase/recombinase XerD